MPRPIAREQRYVPGLDGLRAIAVLCVIAYHINAPWAKGGMLGVGVFFTLSGYLITDLLLNHYRRYGNLGLKTFWIRRARRLLPALFVMLAVVSVLAALFDSSQLGGVRRQVVSGAFYYANWSTIAAHGSYFARFAQPLPLDHLWSLSIEEQFYFVWPFMLLLAIRFLPSRKWLLLVTVLGALASAIWTASLYHPGTFDPTRLYEGTDTRAFELLLGAALAILLPTRISLAGRRVPARRVLMVDLAGVVGLLGIFLLVWQTTPFSSFLYPWGLLLLSFATLSTIAAVVHPASAFGSFMGSGPLRWIGVRSYGIYLWQWPIVVIWGQPANGVDWGKATLQLAVTLAVAALSWRYIEEPIRHGALGRLWGRARVGAARLSSRRAAQPRRPAYARRTAYAVVGASFAAVLVVSAALAGLLPNVSPGHHSAAEISTIPQLSNPQVIDTSGSSKPDLPPFVPIFKQVKPPTHTLCRAAVYIGDSTSEGQVSSSYIPNPSKRLEPVLRRVGVRTVFEEVSGARSILETFQGNASAQTVALDRIAAGYHGCWILALGTNDAADVAVGSSVGMVERIHDMMKVIGRQPVLWVDSISLLSSTAYAESEMQQWNHDLLAACKRYPNMRIFDWASHAKRRWFIADGIHYYSPGYVARNRFIAKGLVKAFPKGQPPSSTCLVS